MTAEFGFKRRVLALAAGAMLVTLLAACGGDKKDDSGTSGSSSGSGSTPATSSTQASSNGGTGAASTPASGATSSASSSTSGLAGLKSYKYTLKMSGNGGPVGEITAGLGGNATNAVLEVAGAWIKPDKAQTTIKIAGLETATTVIGNQQWNTFAGQTQGPTAATASDLQDANFLLGFWDGDDISGSIKDFKCGNKESVNGISAKKCTADKAIIDQVAKENPDFLSGINASSLSAAQIDIWLADDGYPVRMRMDVTGKDTANKDFNFKVDMDVTDINGNFQITAPKT